jgi:hypothetical protein
MNREQQFRPHPREEGDPRRFRATADEKAKGSCWFSSASLGSLRSLRLNGSSVSALSRFSAFCYSSQRLSVSVFQRFPCPEPRPTRASRSENRLLWGTD